jgi:DNA-binding MarR family transcriptional regulator
MEETDPVAGLAGELAGEIARLGRKLASQQPPGLASAQVMVLGDLVRGPLRPGQLAVLERMTAPSMTRHLNELETRELIARKPDPEDKRQAVIELTDQGRTALLAAYRDAWLASRLRELDPAELDVLRAAVPVLAKLHTISDSNGTE